MNTGTNGILAAAIGLTGLAAATGQLAADGFGLGENHFTIGFTLVSGDASGANGTFVGHHKTFTDPGHDFWISVHQITNSQWSKFEASTGLSFEASTWAGDNVPVSRRTWLEAAQFVNWLNTSTGHQAAYKFTGTQGTPDYTFATWDPAEAWGGDNLYRHREARYFLPTDDEWVKAAYWNGVALQEYATKPGDTLHQGDGVSGTGWNYWDDGFVLDPAGPWAVGAGSEELNGTRDMMGNLWDWLESPYLDPPFPDEPYATNRRGMRGGTYGMSAPLMALENRAYSGYVDTYYGSAGLRVASVPEPRHAALLAALAAAFPLWRRLKWRAWITG
jgi:formylglycine-generating enzyme required for sulfatase activity